MCTQANCWKLRPRLDARKFLPDGECQEQTRRSAVHETTTNLHEKGSTNSATNTNKLNMSGLELAVDQIKTLPNTLLITDVGQTIACLDRGNQGAFTRLALNAIGDRSSAFW